MRKPGVLALAALALTAAAPATAAIQSPATAAAPAGTILYVTSTGALNTIKADGTGNRRIPAPGKVIDARWSPDGTKLAVTILNTTTNNADIYTMTATGGSPKRLTTSTNFDGGVDWSPDGTRLSYISCTRYVCNLFVMPAAGGTKVKITNARSGVPDCAYQQFQPPARWSPDGTKIVVGLYCDTDMGYDESIVLDAKTGAAGANPTAADVTWAPTGGQMVGTGFEDTDTFTYIPAIYDDRGVRLRWLPAGDGSTSMVNPVFSKDGANIAVSTYDEWGSATTPAGLWTIPAAGGARRLVLRGVDIKPMQWR